MIQKNVQNQKEFKKHWILVTKKVPITILKKLALTVEEFFKSNTGELKNASDYHLYDLASPANLIQIHESNIACFLCDGSASMAKFIETIYSKMSELMERCLSETLAKQC